MNHFVCLGIGGTFCKLLIWKSCWSITPTQIKMSRPEEERSLVEKMQILRGGETSLWGEPYRQGRVQLRGNNVLWSLLAFMAGSLSHCPTSPGDFFYVFCLISWGKCAFLPMNMFFLFSAWTTWQRNFPNLKRGEYSGKQKTFMLKLLAEGRGDDQWSLCWKMENFGYFLPFVLLKTLIGDPSKP